MTRLPGTGWCPPGGCAARRAAELELAVALAFEHGRAYERAELAALDGTTWRPLARRTREQQHAERMAEMDQAAELVNAQLGRPPGWTYPGGHVDWETGRPVRRLERAA